MNKLAVHGKIIAQLTTELALLTQAALATHATHATHAEATDEEGGYEPGT